MAGNGSNPSGTTDLAVLTRELDGCTITAAEAVKLASMWWDRTGRKLINKAFNRDRVDVHRGPGKNGAPAFTIKGVSNDVVIPSRILEGEPWAQLERRERALVVTSWLSQYRALYRRGDEARKCLTS